jgi:hypothetical protein
MTVGICRSQAALATISSDYLLSRCRSKPSTFTARQLRRFGQHRFNGKGVQKLAIICAWDRPQMRSPHRTPLLRPVHSAAFRGAAVHWPASITPSQRQCIHRRMTIVAKSGEKARKLPLPERTKLSIFPASPWDACSQDMRERLPNPRGYRWRLVADPTLVDVDHCTTWSTGPLWDRSSLSQRSGNGETPTIVGGGYGHVW